MENIKRRLLHSHYVKYIYQLAIGSFIAQGITVLIAPIMTRLYKPEEIGIYTLTLTIITIFGPVICGKYEQAIVVVENEKKVFELIVGSLMFACIFLLLIILGLNIFLTINSQISEQLGDYLYIIISILFLTAFVNILTAYNNRHKEYKTISSVTVTRTLSQNIGIVIFGGLKFGTIGLLLSQLFGMLVGFRKQGKNLYENKLQFKNVRFQNIKKVLIQHNQLPLYSMPAHFINAASYSILNFFIMGLFGLATFGFYAISYRILGLPLNLISVNVSKVFFQKASEEKKSTGNYIKSFRSTSLFLTCLSVPLCLLLMIFSPRVFEIIFGAGWGIAGEFVKILAPMYAVRFIVTALAPALIISGKQKVEFYMSNMFIIASLLVYFICDILHFDIFIFLMFVTISYSIIYILFFIYIYHLSKLENSTEDY